MQVEADNHQAWLFNQFGRMDSIAFDGDQDLIGVDLATIGHRHATDPALHATHSLAASALYLDEPAATDKQMPIESRRETKRLTHSTDDEVDVEDNSAVIEALVLDGWCTRTFYNCAASPDDDGDSLNSNKSEFDSTEDLDRMNAIGEELSVMGLSNGPEDLSPTRPKPGLPGMSTEDATRQMDMIIAAGSSQ